MFKFNPVGWYHKVVDLRYKLVDTKTINQLKDEVFFLEHYLKSRIPPNVDVLLTSINNMQKYLEEIT